MKIEDVDSWLEQSIIFECLSGSHAYGLNTPESDMDYRGVCIPPKEYIMGVYKFNQRETKDPDRTIFNIVKWIELASKSNPNVLEYLFMPSDCILKTSPHWEIIRGNKDEFLSKKAKFTYTGYAYSQVKRVKGHRNWLLNPPKAQPVRADFGLPEYEKIPKEIMGAIRSTIELCLKNELQEMILETQVIDADFMDTIKSVIQDNVEVSLEEALIEYVTPIVQKTLEPTTIITEIGNKFFPEEIMDIYSREKGYKNALTQWNQYQHWVATRNPKRSELEKKFGYDTKHMSHCFTLLIQGREILEKKTLNVRLLPEDREKCLAIKNGAFSYDELIAEVDNTILGFEELHNKSTLRKAIDKKKMNHLQMYLLETFYNGQVVTNINTNEILFDM
jgi:uncharacterized protein